MTNDRFADWRPPEITEGVPTKWQWLVRHVDGFALGQRTDIGAFTYLNAQGGITIEDGVQIGSHCSIYSVSTVDDKMAPVHLKKNCRIGSHTVVMPGVTVGENAIIGACSFVNKDIPPNVVAYGVPARVRRAVNETHG